MQFGAVGFEVVKFPQALGVFADEFPIASFLTFSTFDAILDWKLRGQRQRTENHRLGNSAKLIKELIPTSYSLWTLFTEDAANDWSRGARPPRAQHHAPRGVTRKNVAKGRWNFMCRARGAPDCARGERDPREDAAKVAFLKSISLETLV